MSIFDSNIEVGFPFQLDRRGRVVDPDYEQHVREMVELVLFTAPGERVHRPDFGCGLLDRLFDRNDVEQSAMINVMVQAALQKWLGKIIKVQKVEVVPMDGRLGINLEYQIRESENVVVANFDPRGMSWNI